MVDAAAEAGADSIKMQKKCVDNFYSKEKLERPFDSPYGKTYGEYRNMFEFLPIDFERMDAQCGYSKVPWFLTVQDWESLHIIHDIYGHRFSHRLNRYKVASSNARNVEFLHQVAEIVPPEYEIVLSVAGSTLPEIETSLDILQPFSRIWLLHCVAEYPTPPERARLGNIPELKKRFGDERIRIGYSGHEEGAIATYAAVNLGAEMVERHFCLSRHSFAHHIECSLEPDEFARMVGNVRCAEYGTRIGGPPDVMFQTDFGMSEQERPFLTEQTYGGQFLGTESKCGQS
jgi:N-acetylneuraminate synthase